MTFQPPRTVLFTFSQPRFDYTGTLLSPSGPHLTFYDVGDAHSSFSNKLKDYPLSITRVADKALFATLNWGHDPSEATITGLQHGASPAPIRAILDTDLTFRIADASTGTPHVLRWVYAGWACAFHLQALSSIDTSGLSLAPPVIAAFRPKFLSGRMSELEVHREALRTPWLAEYAVVTCIWMECDALFASTDKAYAKKGGGLTLRQGLGTVNEGLNLAQAIQTADGSSGGGDGGGGGGGGGGDGGGGGGAFGISCCDIMNLTVVGIQAMNAQMTNMSYNSPILL